MRTRREWLMSAVAGAAWAACGSQPEAGTETTQEQGGHEQANVPDASEFDPAALKQKLESGEQVFLLDVRTPAELREHGAIPGARNIPIDELPNRLSEVPKDVPVVTYCMAGGRASRAAKLLRENGYEQPIEYGGLTAWKEAGYDVVMPEDSSQ